jgi:hypothetical protein
MSIGSIGSSNLLRSVLNAAYSTSSTSTSSASQSLTDNTQISSIGSLMNAISQMSQDDQDSIKSFLDNLKSSVQNGTFDASTAAEEAPDALKQYAEDNGIDLTDLVQELANGATGAKNSGVYGPPPPPPPPPVEDSESTDATSTSTSLDLSSLQDLSDEEKSDVQSFMETLKSSLEDGTFDADTLAASAPDALQNLAEENGMSVSDLIKELANEAQNAPPPPPAMYGVNEG